VAKILRSVLDIETKEFGKFIKQQIAQLKKLRS